MGSCNPPFCLGTGGWCGCNCGCCPPCPVYKRIKYSLYCGGLEAPAPPCQADFIDPCSGNPVNCVDTIDCSTPSFRNTSGNEVEAQAGYTCEQDSSSDNIELILDFDGCGVAGANCGKGLDFVVVGEGTVTTNGRIGVNCTNYSSTAYLTLNGVENSLAVEDCDVLTVALNWFGDICCGCCLVNIYTEESDYCGGEILGYCDPCLSYRARAAKRNLKRSVLSRMKKVHYKP